jgi:hypothetical protein
MVREADQSRSPSVGLGGLNENTQPIFPVPYTQDHHPCNVIYIDSERDPDRHYVSSVTIDDAHRMADFHRESVLKHHTHLCELLEDRKDAIIKRWTSFGKKKRLSEISNACPSLPSNNLAADCFRGKINWMNADHLRHQFLLYPITSELLSTDPLAFIALAHRRSTLKPETYASHDWEQLIAWLRQDAFSNVYAPGCISMHGKRFGQFVEDFMADEVHGRDACSTYLGLLILERQNKVLQMLCAVIERLVCHITCSSPFEAWDALARENFRKREERTTAYRWNDGIFESPIPDLHLVEELVLAYYNSQQGELAAMYSDVEHNLHMIKEYQDFVVAGVDLLDFEECPVAVVTAATFGTFQNMMRWHIIKKELSAFSRAARVVRASSWAARLAKNEWTEFLTAFKHFIAHTMSVKLHDFITVHINSRTFTTNQERRQKFGSEPTWKILGFRSQQDFHQRDRLLCLLDRIRPEERHTPQILVELAEMLEDKRQAKRLGLKAWQLLSEIGILWRLVELCQLHEPYIPKQKLVRSWRSMESGGRYLSCLYKGLLPLRTYRGGKLERHFNELKMPRHSGVKNIAWLDSVDKQQNHLRIGMELSRSLFLETLRDGGADKDLLNWVRTILTPDLLRLSYPVTSEERRPILSPPEVVALCGRIYRTTTSRGGNF